MMCHLAAKKNGSSPDRVEANFLLEGMPHQQRHTVELVLMLLVMDNSLEDEGFVFNCLKLASTPPSL